MYGARGAVVVGAVREEEAELRSEGEQLGLHRRDVLSLQAVQAADAEVP